MAFLGLAADPHCWDPCDPFRQLYEGLGGSRSPVAECLVAVLVLGWTIEEFARFGWDGKRMARSAPALLLRSGLAALLAQIAAADPDREPDCDDELEDA